MHRSPSLPARFALPLTLSTLIASTPAQEPDRFDWPQWRGPRRDAISRETGLLGQWPEDGPPLAWKAMELGGGYSAPVVAEGRILALSRRGDDEVVWALSEATGEELWTTRLGPACTAGRVEGEEGPGSTPTVDGERVYALGAGGVLACLRAADGEVLWTVSLIDDLDGCLPKWRYNESPLVEGDDVIVTPGAPDATLVALDKASGDVRWSAVLPAEPPRGNGADEPSGAGYSSAIAFDFAGQRQIVQLAAAGLFGVAASDGRLLWSYTRPTNEYGITCSTPVHHDGRVFAASAYGSGGGLVELETDDSGRIVATPVYDTRRMQNHHGGMIVVDDCLYGAHGGNGGGFLSCLDFATGEVRWAERSAPKGSLVLADGMLYLHGEEGPMLLVEPDPDRYVERGRFDPPNRSETPAWTHPVVARGRLYVRDQGVLLCYDVREG